MSDLAGRIARVATLRGRFTLRSGAEADTYFDKYRFEADPRLLGEIALAMAPLVPRGTDLLAGLELGGIPLVTALSRVTGLPARFVRKRAKGYGTAQLAEGGPIAGSVLTVVEDVVTSGGQVIDSCRGLFELGATIRAVVCVIDREQGGRAAVEAEGHVFNALFTRSQLEDAAPGDATL
jgi:orotate phosphoribosyltransferase